MQSLKMKVPLCIIMNLSNFVLNHIDCSAYLGSIFFHFSLEGRTMVLFQFLSLLIFNFTFF